MREFPEPDSHDGSSSQHGTRKRRRPGPRYGDSDPDDDAWLGGKRGEEVPFSPAQQTAAKSASTVAAKMAEARENAENNDTPVTDTRGTQPPDHKRARSRHSGPSHGRSPPSSSSVRRLPSPNTLPTSGRAVTRAMENPRALGSAGRKHRASAGRTSHGSGGGSGAGGGGGGEGGAVQVDGISDGDGGRWGWRGGGGEGLRGVVAVTPQDGQLSPPDPSLMRECLDEYLEVRERLRVQYFFP